MMNKSIAMNTIIFSLNDAILQGLIAYTHSIHIHVSKTVWRLCL